MAGNYIQTAFSEFDFWYDLFLSCWKQPKSLPEDFTIYTTWAVQDYPPNDPRVAGDSLPNGICGVYCFFLEWFDNGWHRDYLYFGKAVNCRQRLLQHFRSPQGRFDTWLVDYYSNQWGITDERAIMPFFAVAPYSVEKRAEIEINLIREFEPRFNIHRR